MIWHADPRRGRLVIAACPKSAAMGVRIGMPIAQANDLANKLAGKSLPQIYQHEPDLDLQALEKVADGVQANLCPMVAIEALEKFTWAGRTLHQPDSLLCDISGVEHLYGGESGLLETAQQHLANVGLVARMAIASSVGAAWAMAHYARPIQTIVSPSETLAAVSRLSIKSLRISPQTVATLERLGVQSVQQLLALPRSGLATRLGKPLVQRIEQLLGEIDEPCNAHRAVADHTHSLDLEYPTTDQRILADRLGRLTDKIRDGLAASHRGALRMTCYLILSDHPPLILDIGLFAPTTDREQLVGLLVGRLESCRLASSVKQITLSVTLSGPLQTAQRLLFPLLCPSDSHLSSATNPPIGNSPISNSPSAMGGGSLPRLINSLSGRLGRDAVLKVLPSDNPLPEKAFRLSPLTGQQNRRRKKSVKSTSSKSSRQILRHAHGDSVSSFRPSRDDALRRPLTLLDHPMPLTAIGMHASSSLPAGFQLGGRLHRVVRFWGPERIETGWWNGPSIRRDYYRVEMDTGGWWWVYRRLGKSVSDSQQQRSNSPRQTCVRTVVSWMLHGRFS